MYNIRGDEIKKNCQLNALYKCAVPGEKNIWPK